MSWIGTTMAQEEFFYPPALAATPRLNGRQLLIVIIRNVAEIFESENFRVTHWKKIKGFQTEIRCKLDNSKIKFNGIFDFKSDDECMEQFNADEIMKMIQRQKEISFKAGMDHKAKEIRNCLGIQEIRFEDED